jgi:hypothetical protein
VTSSEPPNVTAVELPLSPSPTPIPEGEADAWEEGKEEGRYEFDEEGDEGAGAIDGDTGDTEGEAQGSTDGEGSKDEEKDETKAAGTGDSLPEDEVPSAAVAADEPVEASPGHDDAPPVAEDDDPFIAELRRAVTDNEPLGPRDTPLVPPDEAEGPLHDDLDARRFGSRFRRNR